MLEKLDDLRALDAAVVDLKIKPPEGQAANDRKTLPVEGFLEHGRLPTRSPSAHSGGPCAQSAFIDQVPGWLQRLPRRSASSSLPCPEKIETRLRDIALERASTASCFGPKTLNPNAIVKEF